MELVGGSGRSWIRSSATHSRSLSLHDAGLVGLGNCLGSTQDEYSDPPFVRPPSARGTLVYPTPLSLSLCPFSIP